MGRRDTKECAMAGDWCWTASSTDNEKAEFAESRKVDPADKAYLDGWFGPVDDGNGCWNVGDSPERILRRGVVGGMLM